MVFGDFVHQNRRPVKQLVHVGVLQAVLIQRLGQHAAHADERWVLHVHVDARHLRQFGAQFLDDLVGAQLAVRTLFQMHEDAALVQGGGCAGGADGRHETGHVGIGGDDFYRLLLVRPHGVK